VIGFIRYRNAVDPSNGPIEKVVCWERFSPELGKYHEAVAFLKNDLCSPSGTDVYLHNAGGGAARSRATAVHKAISEAIERWAFFDSFKDRSLLSRYGLDVDPTTNGFACHPSLSSKVAREKAFYEAVERWAVFNWWSCHLPAQIVDGDDCNQRIEVKTPFQNVKVVLVFRKTLGGKYVYGFSAASTLKDALVQAIVEQSRNESVLQNLSENFQPKHVSDRRLLYFASEEGFQEFQVRSAASLSRVAVPDKPRVLVDTSIEGPWTKFANVWRVLFEGGETILHQHDDALFLF